MRRVFSGILLALVSWSAVVQAEIGPPNIVYLVSDDQTWSDFGFMGNERVHTPHLDRLAEKSATFENGYLTTSVCRPSLVTLLTGLYPHQHLVHFNHGPPGNSAYNRMTNVKEYTKMRGREFELIRRVETLPRILVETLGYRALQTGKFWEGHWRNGGFTEGMTTFTAPPASQTYGGIRKLASGELVAHGNGDSGLQIGRETMAPIEEFILDCEEERTPWLVWYAPYLPHQPHNSPKPFYEVVENTPEVMPHEIPYFASIAQFDETVGRLVRFVEENSDASNTIFVFVTDNGWSPSERPEAKRPQEFAKRATSKRSPFDEGVRSPVLLRWDGVIPAERHRELVSSVDIVPTLLRLAGVGEDRIEALPGKDLLDERDSNRAVFGAIYPGDASVLGKPERDVAYRWVRQGDYKLILPRGPDAWGGYLEAPALFEVVKDPYESSNVISDPGVEEVRKDLQRALDGWWAP